MSSQSMPERTISLAARMPGPLLPVSVAAASAASTGSMFTTATLTAAALVGFSISGPLAGAAAERFGVRNVLLTSAITHVLMLVLMVSSVERLTRGDTLTSNDTIYTLLLILTLIAGLSTPAVSTFSRAASGEGPAGTAPRGALRAEVRLDDAALIAAPVLLALLSFSFGPTVGLLCSAVLTAAAVPLYAVHRAHPAQLPGESARLLLGGAEHAQQRLLEHLGLAPDPPARHGAPEASPSEPIQPAGERALQTIDWARGIGAAIILAAAIGLVLGGLWITVLDAAQALARTSLFALMVGLITAAGVLGAQWRSARFTEPLVLRRRRLLAALLCLLSLLLGLGALLPAGFVSLLLLSCIAALLSAVLGRLVLGLYAGLAVGVPAHRASTALTAVAGGVLLGLVLGLTLAGIAADELGAGSSAAVVLAGSGLAVVVVFSGWLWGSPRRRVRHRASADHRD